MGHDRLNPAEPPGFFFNQNKLANASLRLLPTPQLQSLKNRPIFKAAAYSRSCGDREADHKRIKFPRPFDRRRRASDSERRISLPHRKADR
jgi:hypothetical protein